MKAFAKEMFEKLIMRKNESRKRRIKEFERYGTTVDEIEWEIDLKRKRLVSIKDPKLVRKLSKIEIRRIRELMKKNE
jgi:hypothetical protein